MLINLTTLPGFLASGKKIAIDPIRIVSIREDGTGSAIELANGEELEVEESFEKITKLCAEAITPTKVEKVEATPKPEPAKE